MRFCCGRVVNVGIESELIAEAELDVQLLMLNLDVLVERTLRSIRALACLNGTSVVPLYLIRSPSEPLLPVVF